MFKVNIKDTKKASNDIVLVSLLLTLYSVQVNSIEFKQANAGWAEPIKKGVFKNSCFAK